MDLYLESGFKIDNGDKHTISSGEFAYFKEMCEVVIEENISDEKVDSLLSELPYSIKIELIRDGLYDTEVASMIYDHLWRKNEL